MYAIAALVYVLVAGQMVGEPLLVRHKDTFLTQEKCQEFLVSDEFGAQKALLTERLLEKLTQMHKEADAAEQGIPLPVVAITASCDKDPRV